MPDAASIEPTQAAVPGSWTLSARVAFRVAFIYGAFFCLANGLVDGVLWMLPWVSKGVAWINHALDLGAAWVGVRYFHLTGEAAAPHPTGSGDTALQYVLCLGAATFAVLGGVGWSLLSEWRRAGRRDYRTLYACLRLALRFLLGAMLLSYGFAKIWPSQFPPPSLLTLTETYGESSPMRLLWTLMGASPAYSFFGGLAEVVPGFLLLFRRTATLGALLAAGVLLNVVLLNFSYDVPVKLFSLHLLTIALFLTLPDVAALWRIFILGQPAALCGLSLPPWKTRLLRYAALALQVATLGGFLYQTAVATYIEMRKQPTGLAPLRGVWVADQAEGFPPEDAWVKVLFDRPQRMLVVRPDGEPKWFDTIFHEDTRRIELPTTKPAASTLDWDRPDDRTLQLSGSWLGKPVHVNLHRIDPATFALQTRGFHWVQEYPFNR